jgi:hypothetical protein
METYSPPYLFRGDRPIIEAAPNCLHPAADFEIRTPHAPTIRTASLIRCGSVTHGFNADQRYVGLTILGRTSTALTVASPPDHNIAPPGYYMLFVVSQDGVPSVGRFIRIGGSDVEERGAHPCCEFHRWMLPLRCAGKYSSPTGLACFVDTVLP